MLILVKPFRGQHHFQCLTGLWDACKTSERKPHIFVYGSCLRAPTKADPKIRIWLEVLNLRSDSRKYSEGVSKWGESRTIKFALKSSYCWGQLRYKATGVSDRLGGTHFRTVLPRGEEVGYLSINSWPSLGKGGSRVLVPLLLQPALHAGAPLPRECPQLERSRSPSALEGSVCSWVLGWALSTWVTVFFSRSMNR